MASIQGMDKLLKKLDSLGGNSTKALERGILKGTKLVQGDAKDLCAIGDGDLRNSIHTGIETKSESVVGKVSTNKEHAPYVEFGTGPVGMASPKDLPPSIASKIQYRNDGWWIHSSDIDVATAEKYHFFRWESPDGDVFYYTEGQPAQPFLYPALKQNERRVKKLVKDEIKKEIRKLGEH
ncbi:MAG: HK97 gp10 family phage protein [Dehalobacter sp.]|nr:HK97 gp10 family phage protein [Dehalobacter sp.]